LYEAITYKFRLITTLYNMYIKIYLSKIGKKENAKFEKIFKLTQKIEIKN